MKNALTSTRLYDERILARLIKECQSSHSFIQYDKPLLQLWGRSDLVILKIIHRNKKGYYQKYKELTYNRDHVFSAFAYPNSIHHTIFIVAIVTILSTGIAVYLSDTIGNMIAVVVTSVTLFIGLTLAWDQRQYTKQDQSALDAIKKDITRKRLEWDSTLANWQAQLAPTNILFYYELRKEVEIDKSTWFAKISEIENEAKQLVYEKREKLLEENTTIAAKLATVSNKLVGRWTPEYIIEIEAKLNEKKSDNLHEYNSLSPLETALKDKINDMRQHLRAFDACIEQIEIIINTMSSEQTYIEEINSLLELGNGYMGNFEYNQRLTTLLNSMTEVELQMQTCVAGFSNYVKHELQSMDSSLQLIP